MTGIGGTLFTGINTFADVDDDGDPDVLITGQLLSTLSSSPRVSKLYLNDGTGTFTELMNTPFVAVTGGEVVFTDVDLDGDQDVFITGRDSTFTPLSKLYTNEGTVSSDEILFLKNSLLITTFPNPVTSNILNLNFNSTNSGSTIVRVYDMKGHLISHQKEFVGVGQQTLEVNISSLLAGSYFVQLENGKNIDVVKFLIH